MKNFRLSFLVFVLIMSCAKDRKQGISFDLVPNQNTTILLEHKPLHYKFSPKLIDSIRYTAEKKGFYRNQSSLPSLVQIRVGDFEFPLYIDGQESLQISINRTNREQPVSIKGYPENLIETYFSLIKTEEPMRDALIRERKKFNKGEANAYIRILDDIRLNRKSVLLKTPYESLYWASLGEFFVAKVEALDKMNIPLKERTEIRAEIANLAKTQGFFTYKSLVNQRAGIRDFTNAWAHSYGIADSVRKAIKKPLQIYDINKLAYTILDRRRNEVFYYIEDENARVYAKMGLMAERLTEGNFKEAEKAMLQFSQLHYDNFPEWVNFILKLHEKMKRVQPGMPAFEFSLPDENGKQISLSSLKGKWVLLDFWASWCSPCLEEFPYMQKIYQKINTDKVVFLGIGLDEEKETWQATIKRLELPWIQVYGGKETQNEVFKLYQGAAIPHVVLINPERKITRFNDVRGSYNLEDVLKELVK